jgi:pilus assembly protein CpaB
MDRRRVLLIVALVVAVLGASLTFLYVRNADTRAEEKFVTVDVLRATAVINPGETIEDAQAAGKLALQSTPNDQLLSGYQTTTDALTGRVALTTIYPGEQVIDAKFGDSASVQSSLQIPDGQIAISVNLTDTARVAGFVNPGSNVAIFVSGTLSATGQTATAEGGDGTAPAVADVPITQLLLPRVTVLGVGSTTPVSTTTTDETGASTTEQLPRTLMTLALDQKDAERVIYAAANGELAFALLTDKSTVAPAPPVTAADLLTTS